MRKTKYHVGDRVLIAPKFTTDTPNEMAQYCKRVMTISAVLQLTNYDEYHMREDGGYFYWHDDEIVGRIVRKNRYKVGDVVLIAQKESVPKYYRGELMTVKYVVSARLVGGVYYRVKDADSSWVALDFEIEGCLERPDNSTQKKIVTASTASPSDKNWTEAITITTDGTHTYASLTRLGSNPVSFDASLRRDSRDAHDLYYAAHLALYKLRDKDRQKETPPLYTGDVFCVDSRSMSRLYTTGKIYSIKDGVFSADGGKQVSGIQSFQWLQEKSLARWMEVVK